MLDIEENLINIYKITNLKNNYIYVGSTSKSIQERFNRSFGLTVLYNQLHPDHYVRTIILAYTMLNTDYDAKTSLV